MDYSGDSFIQNRTFDEIEVGASSELIRVLRAEDIYLFAAISGDINPTHLDPEYAQEGQFRDIVGHSLWSTTLLSAIFGNEFPGPGTVYVAQNLNFWRPATVGDTVTVTVICREKIEHNHHIIFDCKAVNQSSVKIMDGTAEVIAPTYRIRRPRVLPPAVHVADREERFQRLLAISEGLPPVEIAVIFPCDPDSLRGPLSAADLGLVKPILVGPDRKIRALAEEQSIDIKGVRIINAADRFTAANVGVSLARDEGIALMKGALSTSELMSPVVARDSGLLGTRRISHVYYASVPGYYKPLLVTDAAVNLSPSLAHKRDIIQNAIDLAHILGVEEPKVAVLAATDQINPKMPSTIDAKALCIMAKNGEITGGIVDGPLAFDEDISVRAARIKCVDSPVAGAADILAAPNVETAGVIAKQLEYFSGALMGGIVLGAKAPIVLTSRAYTAQTRMVSCAIAQLIYHHNREALNK